MIGNREAIYKGSIYKFSIEKCAEGTSDASYRIFNERSAFFHFVMRRDPCEPPVITALCVEECMCAHSHVSHM